MRYLLDTNLVPDPNSLPSDRKDLFILHEIFEECSPHLRLKLRKSSVIQTLSMKPMHVKRLNYVMEHVGNNTSLINLYTNQGASDVAMLAYVFAEREDSDNLFARLPTQEMQIVTNDKPLTEAARKMGIKCIDRLI